MNRTKKASEDRQAEEILSVTLRAVAARRRAKVRRRAVEGALLVLLAVGWGFLSGREDGGGRGLGTVSPAEGPAQIAVEESAAWDGPWSLLLVATGEGMEMRAMSAEQVAALARKPGCEFDFTSDAVLLVTDYADEAERFGFDGSY